MINFYLLVNLLHSRQCNFISLIDPILQHRLGSCALARLSGVVLRMQGFALDIGHGNLIAMEVLAISQDGEIWSQLWFCCPTKPN